MSKLERVVWAKGMLLTPQHFQAHTDYVDDTLQFRLAASIFANWGLTELVCDEVELAKGEFSVQRCSGILSDGTAVSCRPGHDAPPPMRNLAQHFPANETALDVFIAIPKQIEGQNVRIQGSGEGPRVRFSARVKEVPDENGLDEPKPVQFAGRNLVLLFGRQNLDGYASLRIAQVIRNQTGGYVLNPEFIPPLLNLAASTTLLNLVKRLVEILGAKSEALSGTRRSRGKTLADFNVSETGSFWLLHTVNTYLPELKHIHDVRRGHPEPLYLSLLKMAGALSTFSFEDNTRNLPAYDHDNLGPCFAALEMAVRDLLDTVIPSKCVNIPLKQNQRIWSGAITNDAWLQNSQMILAIAAPGMGVTDLIERVRMLVKLSPPDEINNLISHALPALKLVHASPPPAAVPNRSDFQYFTVNQAGRLWDGIQRSRSLSLYVPLDLPGARPEIYIVLP